MLLRLTEEWKNGLENRNCAGAVLIDLSKVFHGSEHRHVPGNRTKWTEGLANTDQRGQYITAEETVKLLGVHLGENINLNRQIEEFCRKAASQLNVLQRLAGP